MRQCVIIDPGFVNFSGHHHELNRSLHDGLEGFASVSIAAGGAADRRNQLLDYAVEAFSGDFYATESLECWPIGEPLERVYQELTFFLKEKRVTDGDVLLVHTGSPLLYAALARYLVERSTSTLNVYLSIMFDVGSPDKNDVTRSRVWSQHKLSLGLFSELSRTTKHHIFVDVPSADYLRGVRMLLPGIDVGVHPSYSDADGGERVAEHLKPHKCQLFLGGAKRAKGLEFSIVVAERLAQTDNLANYSLHFNDEAHGTDSELRERVKRLDDAGLDVFWGPMSQREFLEAIEMSSSICLFYDPADYEHKTSGIVWDVLQTARRTTPIVTQGTWAANELLLLGCPHKAIPYGDCEAAVYAIKAAAVLPRPHHELQNSALQFLKSSLALHIQERLSVKHPEDKVGGLQKPGAAGRKILLVRTKYEHFSKFSGPAGFVRHLREDGYEVDVMHVPLDQKIEGQAEASALQALQAKLSSYQAASIDVERDVVSLAPNYDVIHFLDGEHSGALTAVLRSELSFEGKLVITFHQPVSVLESLVIDAGWLQAFDTVHIMSPCQKDFFVSRGLPPAQLELVPHGLDRRFEEGWRLTPIALGQINEQRELEEMFADKRVVLTVGAWLRDFEVLAEIAERMSEDAVIFVIVSHGLENDCLLGLDNLLVINSGMEDAMLQRLYRRADLLCLPLKDGCANNAILEALMNGLPIFTTDLPATRYYCGDAAFFGKSGQEFASAIRIHLNSEQPVASTTSLALEWRDVSELMGTKLYGFSSVESLTDEA